MAKSNICPTCGHTLDTHEALEKGSTPRPRDISICAYCGELFTYTSDLELEKMSKEKFNSFPTVTKNQIIHSQRIIRSIPNKKII